MPFRPRLEALEALAPLSSVGVPAPTYAPSAVGVMTPLYPPGPNDPDGGQAFFARYTQLPYVANPVTPY